ncbi:MAG: hypothetical protein WC671_02200 [Candidatus Paceibacterota bacterium]|jgi:hypothetical protein
MKLLKTKKNRELAQYRRRKSSGSGFVILFAVTLSAIFLSIALGVTNIAFREIKFSTSAKNTNDAFFAADSGIECAMVNDKSTGSSFLDVPISTMICLGGIISIIKNDLSPYWSFELSGLGGGEQGCAKVTMDKTDPSITKVISKGYSNNGSDTSCQPTFNSTERQIELSY